MSEPADTQYQELHEQIADLKLTNGKLIQELANAKNDQNIASKIHLAKMNSLSAEKQLLHDKYVNVLERLVANSGILSRECDCND